MRKILLVCLLSCGVASAQQLNTSHDNNLTLNLGSPSSAVIMDQYSNKITITVAPSEEVARYYSAVEACKASYGDIGALLDYMILNKVGGSLASPLAKAKTAYDLGKASLDGISGAP